MLLDPKQIHAIMNMHIPQNSLQIQVFNGMVQFYRGFIKKNYNDYGSNN
jgi:hypothetical protein